MKKILSILMALAMVLTCASFPAFAEGESVKITPMSVTSNQPAVDTTNTLDKAFDGNYGTGWGNYYKIAAKIATTAKGEGQLLIDFDFGFAYNITQLNIAGLDCHFRGFALYGSNDLNGEWTELADLSVPDRSKAELPVIHEGYYRYIRFEGYKVNYTGNAGIEEMELFGVLDPIIAKVEGLNASNVAYSGASLRVADKQNMDTLFDGDLTRTPSSGEAINGIQFNWTASTTVKNIEVTLNEVANLVALNIYWGNSDHNALPAQTYNVYFAGEDGVYGAAAYSYTDSATSQNGKSRDDVIILDTVAESVKKIKIEITAHYATGDPAIREIEIFSINESQTPDIPDGPKAIKPIGGSADNGTGGGVVSDRSISKLIDDDLTNYTQINPTNFVKENGSLAEYVFNFDEKYTFNSIEMIWSSNRLTAADIYVSDNGTNWGTAVYSETGITCTTADTTRIITINLPEDVSGKYLKIVVKDAVTYGWCRFMEISFVGTDYVESETGDTEKPINLSLTGVSAPAYYDAYNRTSQTRGSGLLINATDGDVSTRYTVSTYNNSWSNVSGYDIVFDLGMKTTLDTLTLRWGGAWGQVAPKSYTLAVSENGTSYTTVKTYDNLYNIALGLASAPASANTTYTSRIPDWITNPTTSNDAYAFLDITEKNLNLENVRYIKVTPTNFRYRASLAEISAKGFPNEEEKLVTLGGNIRLPDDNRGIKTGLRFGAKVIRQNADMTDDYSYNTSDTKLGMFLLPKDMLASGQTLTQYLANGVQNALDIPAKKTLIEDDNFIAFTAVLTDIPTNEYGREIVAVPYMLKDGVYTYFEEMTKSYKGVAAAAREKQYTDDYAATRSTEAERARCRDIAYMLDCISVGRSADYTYVTENTPTTLPTTRYSQNALNLYSKLDNGINISTGTYNFSYNTSTYQSMINDIKNKGFDHVRLPIDLRNYTNSDGSLKTLGTYSFSKIDNYIETAINAGLVVTLDFHAWWDFSLFGGDDTRFVNTWKNIAERYKDKYTDMLIFEFMNEPRTYLTDAGADMNAENLEEMMVRCIDTVRAIDSDRVVAVALIDSNSPHQLAPEHINGSFRDTLLMNYTDMFVVAHCYAPLDWTHQDLSWNGTSGVTVTLTEARLDELKTELGKIVEFQNDTGILVLLNELGFNTRSIPKAEQITYLQTMMDIIKPEGIPNTWWSYANNITSGDFTLMPNSSTHLYDIIFADYPTAEEKYIREIDGVKYYDVKAATLSATVSDYSKYFPKDAEGYYLDGMTFPVDAETFNLILSKPCEGTGSIKWTGYNKWLSFSTSDMFDGILPVDKMDDPLYVYMCKPSERPSFLNRVNALNMGSETEEHNYIIPIGAIYSNPEKPIPDDAELTICLGRMAMTTYTEANGWELTQDLATPSKPNHIYYLPWELESTLGSMTLPADRVTLVDDHYEIKLTGAEFNGADKADQGATGSCFHFWGKNMELTEKFTIKGVATSYECWIKEPEWAEYVVATIGADWKIGTTGGIQVFAGHTYAITTEPRVIFGHNVGPTNYDNIMDTETVQEFLQLNK